MLDLKESFPLINAIWVIESCLVALPNDWEISEYCWNEDEAKEVKLQCEEYNAQNKYISRRFYRIVKFERK